MAFFRFAKSMESIFNRFIDFPPTGGRIDLWISAVRRETPENNRFMDFRRQAGDPGAQQIYRFPPQAGGCHAWLFSASRNPWNPFSIYLWISAGRRENRFMDFRRQAGGCHAWLFSASRNPWNPFSIYLWISAGRRENRFMDFRRQAGGCHAWLFSASRNPWNPFSIDL